MRRSIDVALKDALSDASADLDTGAAVARLTAADYRHGRSPRHRPPVRARLGIAGGAGLVAAATAALLVLSSGGSGLVPLAYAGYSASPTTPTPAELKPAIAECKQWLRPSSVNDGYPGRLVLTDKRGSYVVALYAIGPNSQFCIFGEGADEGGGGGSGVLAGNPAPGQDQLGVPSGGASGAVGFPGGNTEADEYGLAGRGVTAVTFILRHHKTVNATVENGWYFAWWPEMVTQESPWGSRPVAVRVTTASGTVTSPMPYPGKACSAHPNACVFRLHGPTWAEIHHIF
jgi:hypothetical protein